MKRISLLIACLFASTASFSNENCDNLQTKEAVLIKIGYGPTANSLDKLSQYCHYKDWLDAQIDNVNLYDDAEIKNDLANLEISNKNLFELLKSYDYSSLSNKENANKPFQEGGVVQQAFKKRVSYALYSENRLREMMVWFWFNHFSVNSKDDIPHYIDDYESIFRRKAFSNFRDILWEVSHHPAMLKYLNNNDNKKPIKTSKEVLGRNENYAREFLELHTMGINSGYTQKDVEELTKILTGFTSPYLASFKQQESYVGEYENIKTLEDYKKFIASKKNLNFKVFDSLAYFENEFHDDVDKNFLGKKIKSNKEKELEEVIDIVANHPQTAKFISNKLGVFFLGENPNSTTLSKMSDEFLKTKGDIGKVLKVLFDSEQFKVNLSVRKMFKNPYEYFISTTKITLNGDKVDDFRNLYFVLNKVGFGTYFKLTPEGYSLNGKDYLSSNLLHEYINFSKFITSPQMFNKQINIENNYYKLNQDKYLDYLISEDWLNK